MPTVVQSKSEHSLTAYVTGITFDDTATLDNLLLVVMGQRNVAGDDSDVPSGWTLLGYGTDLGIASSGLAVIGRIADGTETDIAFTNAAPGTAPESAIFLEVAGLDAELPDVVSDVLTFLSDATPSTPALSGITAGVPIVVLACFWEFPDGPGVLIDVAGYDRIEDTGAPGVGNRHRLSVHMIESNTADTDYPPATADLVGTATDGIALHIALTSGEPLPDEPPIDPGYEPPDPGRAILEIYVHDEDATRWGTATWSADLVPTGTEGIWSGAGWQDVTPQGVSAHVVWGSSRPERGLLAIQEAQKWLVTTYDPDRVLDPGNPDSPYAPQLITGVPIRIRNEATGRVVRTGVIDRLSYAYKPPFYQGVIEASSSIAIAWRAMVPADSVLGDTLRTRIVDAYVASGITMGGIPLVDNGSDSYPDVPLSDRMPDEQSLWTHIYRAAEEVGWVAYEDAAGTIRVAPYMNGPDRGATITYENLEDLTSRVSDDGQYSVVRVLEDDGTTVLERESAPLPRYGRIVYDEREDITTLDASGFADAVLSDRAVPGVVWAPGTFWCFDAADVEFMAGLELLERVAIVVPDVLEVSGPLLGMELWVEQRTETRAQWLFLPRIATTGSAAVGVSMLLADDDGSFLLADDDDANLEPDDV